MSIALGVVIYAALVAFVSSVMVYYLKITYPREEEQLKENSKWFRNDSATLSIKTEMTFLLGMGLGSLLTIGAAFVFAADENILDEGDENYYN